jgi:hypothetical protein
MGLPAKPPKTAGVRRGCITVLLSALFLCSPPAAGSPAEREYEDAARSFRTGRLAEAFGQFTALANRGDVDAARIALFMHSYGPALYGRQWDAAPQNVAYWSALVRNSGPAAGTLPEFQPAARAPAKARPRPAPPRHRQPELANIARD